MIPQRKKIRKKTGVKNICKVEDVRCWFDKTDKTIKFRKKGRRQKIDSISVTQLYDNVKGQFSLPL